MDERRRRIGANEALYRSINERIEDLNAAFGLLSGTMAIVCECGNIECVEQIDVDIATFERVRADPAQFMVIPGHEIPDVEHVVERHETYFILRKDPGGPAELAESLDERS